MSSPIKFEINPQNIDDYCDGYDTLWHTVPSILQVCVQRIEREVLNNPRNCRDLYKAEANANSSMRLLAKSASRQALYESISKMKLKDKKEEVPLHEVTTIFRRVLRSYKRGVISRDRSFVFLESIEGLKSHYLSESRMLSREVLNEAVVHVLSHQVHPKYQATLAFVLIHLQFLIWTCTVHKITPQSIADYFLVVLMPDVPQGESIREETADADKLRKSKIIKYMMATKEHTLIRELNKDSRMNNHPTGLTMRRNKDLEVASFLCDCADIIVSKAASDPNRIIDSFNPSVLFDIRNTVIPYEEGVLPSWRSINKFDATIAGAYLKYFLENFATDCVLTNHCVKSIFISDEMRREGKATPAPDDNDKTELNEIKVAMGLLELLPQKNQQTIAYLLCSLVEVCKLCDTEELADRVVANFKKNYYAILTRRDAKLQNDKKKMVNNLFDIIIASQRRSFEQILPEHNLLKLLPAEINRSEDCYDWQTELAGIMPRLMKTHIQLEFEQTPNKFMKAASKTAKVAGSAASSAAKSVKVAGSAAGSAAKKVKAAGSAAGSAAKSVKAAGSAAGSAAKKSVRNVGKVFRGKKTRNTPASSPRDDNDDNDNDDNDDNDDNNDDDDAASASSSSTSTR